MGVWIETQPAKLYKPMDLSHPAWVCGLKRTGFAFDEIIEVTPCVGVWIETYPPLADLIMYLVTPCVGVWIET